MTQMQKKPTPSKEIPLTRKLKVLNVISDTTFDIPLEEYVWRVAAKEVPLSFHDEAIKAQIVASRTYALRKISANAHKDNADVCTDYNHCTAFLLQGEESVRFGASYQKACERLQELERDTQNQIITYQGKPILSVFHAISSGITERSSDVWQTQLPYLTNVDSSADISIQGFSTTVSFTDKELKEKFSTDVVPEFEILSRTKAGSVKRIKVCNKEYSGTEIRKMLNLRSSNFTIEKSGNIYSFHVKGYGHGVGMSQSGANEYAKKGLTYKEILLKYYPGTTITNINN